MSIPSGRVSRGAEDFIRQCLQKDPRMRPSTAQLLKHPWLEVRPALPEMYCRIVRACFLTGLCSGASHRMRAHAAMACRPSMRRTAAPRTAAVHQSQDLRAATT